MIEIRWSKPADAEALARLHAASWRHAYAGILARPVIERMISHRGPSAWRGSGGGRALVLLLDGVLLGYATMGYDRRERRTTSRLSGGRSGEIFELYLAPEAQGWVSDASSSEAALAELRAHGTRSVRVWALAENELGCRFYRALGGTEEGRVWERIGGGEIEKIAFRWV